MDLNFRSVGNKSEFTGEAFVAGDEVVSFLHQAKGGSIERVDLLKGEVERYEFEGPVICRWSQRIRKKDESEAEAKKQALHSSEELFLSLYYSDEEEGNEASSMTEEACAELEKTKTILKFFLSLHLERKRILRTVGSQTVLHVKSKKTYTVPVVEINDELLIALHGQLENLVLA